MALLQFLGENENQSINDRFMGGKPGLAGKSCPAVIAVPDCITFAS